MRSYRIRQLLAYRTVPNFVCTQFNESLKCSSSQFTFLLAKQLFMKSNISSPLVTSAGMINVYSAANVPEPNQYEITAVTLKTNPGCLPQGSSPNLTKLSFYQESLISINTGFPQVLIQKTCWFRPIYYLLLM